MLKKLFGKREEGFTIIEVMIVLAIAGLIMVIVFIAVPQLQRNSRDRRRQDTVGRIKAELDTYAGNNNGNYPFRNGTGTGSMADFNSRYITNKVEAKDPSSGTDYTIAIPGAGTNNPNATQIYVYPGMSCSGEDATGTFAGASSTNNERRFAVRAQLDRSGTFYCVDNG